MEAEFVCVPITEYLWQRMYGTVAHASIVSLISQCVVWMSIFYAFHRFKLFCQGRQRKGRLTKVLEDHRMQSQNERKDIEGLCLKAQAAGGTGYGVLGGAAEESLPLVPVSICVDDDNSCGDADSIAGSRLKHAASQLSASRQEVTFLQACSGPVVQTKLTRLLPQILADAAASTAKKPASKSEAGSEAVVKERTRFLLQLGESRIFRPSVGDEEARMLKLDDTNPVPVILHSSYSTGKLTVEGLHLRQATIQAATMNKCLTLDTNYNQVTEYVVNDMSNPKGLCRLEVFTFETGLPSKNLGEVFVLASKKFDKDGFKLSVNSLAGRIQNDNLQAVLRSIFPYTILAIYAMKQLLSSMMAIMESTNTTSIVAWLIPCIIVATPVLPLRTETSVTTMLYKLAVRAYYTLYFAAQCFVHDKDPKVLSMNEGDSRSEDRLNLKPEESSSVQSGMSVPSCKKNSDLSEDEEKAHHSSVVNPAWEWTVFDSVYDKKTQNYDLVKRVQSKEKTSSSEKEPFEVIYHHLKDFPWASQVEVRILSPILMDSINKLMPGKVDQSAKSKKNVLLKGPDLFHVREKLRNEQTSAAEQEEASEDSSSGKEKLLHVNHLLRFMDKELEDVTRMYTAMKSGKCCVSWEMLWAFFPLGERVVYLDDVAEEELCGDVLRVSYKKDENGQLLFVIQVTTMDYNCNTWEEYSRNLTIPMFTEEREIRKLCIYPLQLVEDPDSTIRGFLDHGRRFCQLSMKERSCFMNYKGSMIRYKRVDGGFQLLKQNADGRVMIDLGSFAKMNPYYPALASAKPPYRIIRDNKVRFHNIENLENRMFAPAIVYGFSFRLKQWGSFSVAGFSGINFNTSAFDDLVMEGDTKDIIEKLVQKQLDDGKGTHESGLDSIPSKGEGMIFLCYGPPGTGKTLTAESLSEKLQCPLWCLSVSELGTTPQTLEGTLVKVFDVAASWGALLLLDEADVFLERRTTADLTRNAMTGVFLRVLEYYKGVLFLTTNRHSEFDDAICSRITLKLRYEKHNENQRRALWNNLLERVGLNDISPGDIAEFTEPDFNGREIRNIVKTAHTLSKCEDNGGNLEVKHVKKALKVYKDSCKDYLGSLLRDT